ncbi:MAG: nucleoside recognition protein [Christensenellales bacterium]
MEKQGGQGHAECALGILLTSLVYGMRQPQLAARRLWTGNGGGIAGHLLLGITMLYMGLMEIATKAGWPKGVQRCGRAYQAAVSQPEKAGARHAGHLHEPIHNALGMGNAATPLGLAAMEELQKKNKEKKRATNEMVALIVLNASSVQLIPTSIIALRAAAGSADPAGITGVMLLATLATTLVGAVLCRVFGK